MMRIFLHIGLDQVGASRLQGVLADKRAQLSEKGILFPRSCGAKNHTRLFMAVTDPENVDSLRFHRGYAGAASQEKLRREVLEGLKREIAAQSPDVLILSANQLGSSLHTRSEIERLHQMLCELSTDIRVVAHIDEQAKLLARRYSAQVMEGRAASLESELQIVASDGDWWTAAINARSTAQPHFGLFADVQSPPFWLDYAALQTCWESVFGAQSMTLRPYEAELFFSAKATDEIRAAFEIEPRIGRAVAQTPSEQPSAAWLTRARQLNHLLLRLMNKGEDTVPRQLWRKCLNQLQVPGDPIDPASLSAVSAHFAAANARLIARNPALAACLTAPDGPVAPWQEADPTLGYRPSQYLMAFMHSIKKASREARRADADPVADDTNGAQSLTVQDGAALPPKAKENFDKLISSPLRPHNRIGTGDEEQAGAPYTPVTRRDLSPGNSGKVIVGCMKNEAPYIVEWIAYHRAIGVDNFLIYTNDCSDGTAEILDRLQDMGIVQHRNNDKWKGKSPQQHALNQAQKEPLLKNAEWVIHIDVDEFINVRCDNGTLDDFLARVPGATNVAMTWRMFGHNGVTALSDDFVIKQFDNCAPKFCPKPHTVWGFKTMFANIGAYRKISCHRPNKLIEGFEERVKWVNGSGVDMTAEARDKGWRNSVKTIGYDLLQLNHYALRSAESFLIKRQRGRALHVDRAIGLNYWIRMDWSDFKDVTIQRNLPRLQAEYDALMADKTLRRLHDAGCNWHREKVRELRDMPEFGDLYAEALKIDLNETERVAYALALDMES